MSDTGENPTTALSVAVLEAMPVGVAIFDANQRLVLMNAAYCASLDLPPGHFPPGTSLEETMRQAAYRGVFGPGDPETQIRRQMQVDRSRPSPLRQRRFHGRSYDLFSTPLPGGGHLVNAVETTALVSAREALIQTAGPAAHLPSHPGDEAEPTAPMLRVLLDTIPLGLCVYGPDGRVRMFNPAYAQIMEGAEVAVGDHRDDVLRRRVEDGEYGPLGLGALHRSARDLDFTRAHIRPRRQRPNGVLIDVRIAPLPDGGHVLVVTDATRLAQAEAALARHAAEMDAMLTHSRHGVLLWSPEKTLLAANQIVAELIEVPPEMLVRGLTERDLLLYLHSQGAFKGDAETYLETHLQHDRNTPLRSFRQTQSGRVLDIRSDPAPGSGYVVTFTDITDRRRTEQELRAAMVATEEANAARARFLATMSHELRTPLNSVIGFSDTLMRDRGTTDPAQIREYAEDINNAGKRLLMLINNMLDVARIEAGRFDLGTDRIDVRRMVQSCLRQQRAAAVAAEIDLFDELPTSLPLVRGDERRMQQVLINLLSNAMKFTEAGGSVTVTAVIDTPADASKDTRGDLLLRVRDTGIGIPADKIALAFEPFTQIDSGLARRFEGSGLGLYFSRALVQAHGGTLSLHSLVGEGTTAEIRLPARRLDAG